MIDDAYKPFHRLVEELLAFQSEFVDEDAGVRSHIYRYELEVPIELDVVRSGANVAIGSTPPLYNVATSFRPSIHRVTLVAEVAEPVDGD